MYVDGICILDTDCVTGNKGNHDTYDGHIESDIVVDFFGGSFGKVYTSMTTLARDIFS